MFKTLIEETAKENKSRIVLALDFPFVDIKDQNFLFQNSQSIIEKVYPYICAVKINHHLVLPLGTFQGVKKLIEIIHEKGPEKFSNIILSAIQTFFIDNFLETSQLYPSDHSILKGGKTSAAIEGTLDKVDLYISYEDTSSNIYEPLHATIKINDIRKTPKPLICPIEISMTQDYLKTLEI